MKHTLKREHSAPSRVRKAFGAGALLAIAVVGFVGGDAQAQSRPPSCAWWQGPVYSGGRWVCMNKQQPMPTSQNKTCPIGTTAVRSGSTVYCQRLGR